MSTIVAVKKSGQCAIAADTLTVWGDTREDADTVANACKILEYDGNYFAFVGHSSWRQIFSHYFAGLKKPPVLDSVPAIYDFAVTMHPVLRDQYYIRTTEREDDHFESSQFYFLLANKHGIYGVDSLRFVEEYNQFYSYGSGYRLALGAMHAVWEREKDASKIAEIGVQAAARFDKDTALPMHSFKTDLAEK